MMRGPYETTLETPFGPMRLVVWESSMFVSCGNQDEPGSIVINNVEYDVRYDMRYEDGGWKRATYFSSDRHDSWGTPFSSSARQKFVETVPDLMIEWAVTEEAAAIFKRLRAEEMRERLEGLNREVADLRRELNEKVAARNRLAAEIDPLRNQNHRKKKVVH